VDCYGVRIKARIVNLKGTGKGLVALVQIEENRSKFSPQAQERKTQHPGGALAKKKSRLTRTIGLGFFKHAESPSAAPSL
jgi:hypothetical protein